LATATEHRAAARVFFRQKQKGEVFMRVARAILLVSAALLFESAAMASERAIPAQSVPNTASGRSDCQPAERGSGKNLSDQLAQSKGVICPPKDVDPQMTAPPPGGGSMPIIPPPGSPGGNPNVQPK
jgi:hypothetical protein